MDVMCPLRTQSTVTPTTSTSIINPPPYNHNTTLQPAQPIPSTPISIISTNHLNHTIKNNQNFRVLQLNINAIRNKTHELQQLLNEQNVDVAVIPTIQNVTTFQKHFSKYKYCHALYDKTAAKSKKANISVDSLHSVLNAHANGSSDDILYISVNLLRRLG